MIELQSLLSDPEQYPLLHRLRAVQAAEGLQLVISGVVARYRLLNGGRRQIAALILPGEPMQIPPQVVLRLIQGGLDRASRDADGPKS